MSDGYPETPDRPIEEVGDLPPADGPKCDVCGTRTSTTWGCPVCN